MRPTTELAGSASFASAFPVTRLAVESIALAAEAITDVVALTTSPPHLVIDRDLASSWFAASLRPDGWDLPPVWDPIAGDHATADGWIRLHTNAPRHRRARPDCARLRPRRRHAPAGRRRRSARLDGPRDLESAVVDAGGAAAAMRSVDDWAAHPQGCAVATEPIVHRSTGASGAPGRPGPAHRPLDGVRVLDLTRVLAGPVATRFLAGFGADVLRIDPPDWDEPAVVPEVTLGKRCARLDARTGDGRAHLCRLLAAADVLVARVPARCARRAARSRRGRTGRVEPGPRGGLPRRLRLDRSVVGTARLRQPGADEQRHRRGRDALVRSRRAHPVAGAGARPCHRLPHGRRGGRWSAGEVGDRMRLGAPGVAGADGRVADGVAGRGRRSVT